MAKETGLGDHLLVDGYDISGDIGSVGRIAGGPAALDLTDITQSAYQRDGGLRDGGIDFASWFNMAAGRAHPRLSALPTADVMVSYCHGYAQGNAMASCVAKQIGYDGARDQAGNLSYAIATQSNAYGLEWGLQLTPGLRTDTTATSPATGLDGLASTAFGAQFYLHSLALTGTSCTVTIQDSADNATFAALSPATAFTAFTSTPGSQRITYTGTLRRYVRAITTGTFTSATFIVNVVRNQTTVVF